MSIPLHTHGTARDGSPGSVIGRVTTRPLAIEERPDHVLIEERPGRDSVYDGYAGVLTTAKLKTEELAALFPPSCAVVHSVHYLHHLADGDVVALNRTGYVRTLYRRKSQHNTLLATERCNSYCLMCSQPPRRIDDSHLIAEQHRVLELMDPSTRELGITGGEPTLLKRDLLRIVERCKELLPQTALHILSNGRLFYYNSFARDLGAVGHPDLMIGIPLYADVDFLHDHVVQAPGAFDQTMVGLQNLGRWGVAVEVRVVIHRHTHGRLKALAEFIYRNLCFAQHVALMGLEPMGFAIPNLDDLWIDPYEYRAELRAATLYLVSRGMRVSIYNHQLCILPQELWQFATRSISDWKNDYLPVCEECSVRANCGGFFASSLIRRRSARISPIPPQEGSPQPPQTATRRLGD